ETVKRFELDDGKWKNVRERLGNDADKVYGEFHKALEEAHQECADLTRDDESQRWQTNDRVNNEAERIRNEIQPVWQELDDTGEALRLRAIALKDRTKKGKIYDKAEKIRDTIADDKVKLYRLSDGILR